MRTRRIVSVVLTVVAAALSVLSLVAGYVRADLLTTERYVQIVGPLARDPAVQAEVVDAVARAVVDNVPVDELTRDSRLPAALGPLLQNQLDTATRRLAERVVQSPRFAELWIEANRSAHAATVSALRDQGGVLRTGGGEVSIDLSVIVGEVKNRLTQSGFVLAERIPVTDHRVVLVRSDQLARAQAALQLIDQLAPWAPWVMLAFAAAAVAVSPDRRRALGWLGLSVAVAMTLVAATLALGRWWFLSRVADTTVDPAAAAAITDAALDPLWARLVFVLVAALLLAAVALMLGPVGGRVRARISSRFSTGPGSLTGPDSSTGPYPSTGSGPD